MLSILPEKSPFHCLEFSCRTKFTSDIWPLNLIKITHPEHLPVARQKNLIHCSVPLCVKSFSVLNSTLAKIQLKTCMHFPISNTLKSSQIQSLNHCHILCSGWKHVLVRTLHCGITLLSHWNATFRVALRQAYKTIPTTCYATREEYRYILCWIKKKGMKRYYDNMLREESTALRFPSFKTGDGIRNFVATMTDNQALREWELHTLQDVRWNDNHQRPIKYWSQDIFKSM